VTSELLSWQLTGEVGATLSDTFRKLRLCQLVRFSEHERYCRPGIKDVSGRDNGDPSHSLVSPSIAALST
jgi:hypothetical protein